MTVARRGAELNNKKKRDKTPKASMLTTSLQAESTCRATVLMSLLPIKGIKNNCTCCDFCLAPPMAAQCQPKVMFSLPTSPPHALHFLEWPLPVKPSTVWWRFIIKVQRLQPALLMNTTVT